MVRPGALLADGAPTVCPSVTNGRQWVESQHLSMESLGWGALPGTVPDHKALSAQSPSLWELRQLCLIFSRDGVGQHRGHNHSGRDTQ